MKSVLVRESLLKGGCNAREGFVTGVVVVVLVESGTRAGIELEGTDLVLVESGTRAGIELEGTGLGLLKTMLGLGGVEGLGGLAGVERLGCCVVVGLFAGETGVGQSGATGITALFSIFAQRMACVARSRPSSSSVGH